MDPVTRFCAYVLCFNSIILFASAIIKGWNILDKFDKNRYTKRIEASREDFALSVAKAGKRLQRDDHRREAVNFLQEEKKKPIRKAVGYFSDDLAQLLVK